MLTRKALLPAAWLALAAAACTPHPGPTEAVTAASPVLIQETSEIRVMADRARELGKEFGVDQVLLVFDIDNTLLAMDQDLGSDQWFNWQMGEIKTGGKAAVAKDLDGLLQAQAKLAHFLHMHPTEPSTSVTIAQLQDAGFKTVVLTSRRPELRGDTWREMNGNGMNWTKSALEGDGIDMTAGQPKGPALKSLLQKTGRSFKAIVFMDDTMRNHESMRGTFAGTGVVCAFFRYGHEDQRVSAFNAGDKSAVVKAWKEFQAAHP